MRTPSYPFSADALTLQVFAWFSSLSVRERLNAQMHKQHWITNQYRHAKHMFLDALEEALTCLSSDPIYGPALQALARHRVLQASLEDSVARAIAVEDLLDAGHALYYVDRSEGLPSYSVPQPTPDEAAIFQQVLDERGELTTRLQQISQYWHNDVCRGATFLRPFFLGYIDLLPWAVGMPSFLHAFLQSSLASLDWHVIAASILRVDVPVSCQCASAANEVNTEVKMALIQERCAWMGKTLKREGQNLPEPIRNSVLFLADLCDKTGVLSRDSEEGEL